MIRRRLFTISEQQAEFVCFETKKEFIAWLRGKGWTEGNFLDAAGLTFDQLGNRWVHIGGEDDYRYVCFQPADGLENHDDPT